MTLVRWDVQQAAFLLLPRLERLPEATNVVLIGALRTDNMKSPLRNPLNVLLKIFR